ncbi:MAG: GNAT family N-acetyltransferase [Kordia sp.]|nr:MAG: GNAT family N-acetyltransferase [Kordia sp.]
MSNNQSILENNTVKLIPLQKNDALLLENIAFEKDLVYYSPTDISTTGTLKNYIKQALINREKGGELPFIIFDKINQQYVGSTRFGFINTKNKTIHIGWTWIGKAFQGTGLNTHIKFLMLQYAFETLVFEKVEFRIDERNIRSRKAVEKIGGTLEGILRKDTLMQDGFRRSTCCYGILKDEWPKIKETIFKDFT